MDKLFYRLKFKYQRYAINNLALYVSVCFAIGYMFMSTNAGQAFYINYLAFMPREVLHGQVWRILTAIFYPPSTGNIFYAAIAIFIYYNFASTVENTMGEFEYNVYFFGSILVGELGTVCYYLLFGIDLPFIPMFTHFAVLMAFAILYGEASVLLFFLIPIKVKYIALIEVAMYVYYFVCGNAYTRIAIIAAFIPVVIFYSMINKSNGGSGNIFNDIKRNLEQRRRRREWQDQWK